MYRNEAGTLPFLTTHLGNIARSRELGLRFLTAGDQQQHGMNGVSQISMLVDRLRIARWMILIFLFEEAQHTGHEQEATEHPWTTIGPLNPSAMPMAELATLFEGSDLAGVLSQISDDLKDVTWDQGNEDSRSLLIMLSIQLRQCADHLARIVHLCNVSYGIPADHSAMFECIDRIAPKDMTALMSGMGGMMGPGAFNMSWKDARTHVRTFAERLLDIAIEIIAPEAINRGYEQSNAAAS